MPRQQKTTTTWIWTTAMRWGATEFDWRSAFRHGVHEGSLQPHAGSGLLTGAPDQNKPQDTAGVWWAAARQAQVLPQALPAVADSPGGLSYRRTKTPRAFTPSRWRQGVALTACAACRRRPASLPHGATMAACRCVPATREGTEKCPLLYIVLSQMLWSRNVPHSFVTSARDDGGSVRQRPPVLGTGGGCLLSGCLHGSKKQAYRAPGKGAGCGRSGKGSDVTS